MKEISVEIPVGEIVQDAIRKVSGMELFDAIFTLGLILSSPDVDELKKQAKEQAEMHPLSHLVMRTAINQDGKVVERKSSIFSDDPDEADLALLGEMFGLARIHQKVNAQGVIEPARRQILKEHNVTRGDFDEISRHNPFVPEGCERFFSEGLLAGFTGNYVVATHLLIPQLENSIRYVLNDHGVTTSGLDDQGVQEEYDLNKLVRLPQFKKIFSENLAFDLRGLLVERAGSNLRNRFAHGLMSYDEFSTYETIYLWWLILRLCVLGLRQVQNSGSEPEVTDGDPKSETT